MRQGRTVATAGWFSRNKAKKFQMRRIFGNFKKQQHSQNLSFGRRHGYSLGRHSAVLSNLRVLVEEIGRSTGRRAKNLSENAQASLRTIRWIMAILIQASLVRGLIS